MFTKKLFLICTGIGELGSLLKLKRIYNEN